MCHLCTPPLPHSSICSTASQPNSKGLLGKFIPNSSWQHHQMQQADPTGCLLRVWALTGAINTLAPCNTQAANKRPPLSDGAAFSSQHCVTSPSHPPPTSQPSSTQLSNTSVPHRVQFWLDGIRFVFLFSLGHYWDPWTCRLRPQFLGSVCCYRGFEIMAVLPFLRVNQGWRSLPCTLLCSQQPRSTA
jgi:hypothetical protein